MKLLPAYTQYGNVFFSKNGARAYRRGERPACMLKTTEGMAGTCPHHIARCKPGVRVDYTRELVMFYVPSRKPDLSDVPNENGVLRELSEAWPS